MFYKPTKHALSTKCFSPACRTDSFFRPIRTDETQKRLRLDNQAIILDWQHTFQTTSLYESIGEKLLELG